MTPAASVVNSYVITSNCFGPGFEVKQLIQCGCLRLTMIQHSWLTRPTVLAPIQGETQISLSRCFKIQRKVLLSIARFTGGAYYVYILVGGDLEFQKNNN